VNWLFHTALDCKKGHITGRKRRVKKKETATKLAISVSRNEFVLSFFMPPDFNSGGSILIELLLDGCLMNNLCGRRKKQQRGVPTDHDSAVRLRGLTNKNELTL
jgi:hypothetical protein